MLSYAYITIKAVAGRRVRFLGIGRRVEVGEKSRPDIERFIGDQFATRNAAPGFKSELLVTRCPPSSQKNDPATARSLVGPRSIMP